MQTTSALFKALWATPNHWSEVKVNIAGTDYFENQLMSVSIQSDAFSANKLTIGAAPIGSCRVELIVDDMTGLDLSSQIPNGSKVIVYERLHGTLFTAVDCIVGQVQVGVAVAGGTALTQEATSEWLIQGTYYVDMRDSLSTTGVLTLDCVDIMAKADAMFPSMITPYDVLPDNYIVSTIASNMGVAVDPTTSNIVRGQYNVPIPTDYTMREVLGHIAASYAGNYVITKDEKLLLLQYISLPSSTSYLITENGVGITVGGDHIIV